MVLLTLLMATAPPKAKLLAPAKPTAIATRDCRAWASTDTEPPAVTLESATVALIVLSITLTLTAAPMAAEPELPARPPATVT